ncbi:MAG TPA: tetratricopeptide repeat protein [Usitatibacter sp.]|nr:tetratricopeptide repeat protein [Usitatibacter sp.]
MNDSRGISLSVSDGQALDRYEVALAAFRSYRGDPVAPLDAAITRDSGFAAAHVAKAVMLMSMFERRFARDALNALEAGAAAIAAGNRREKALAAAVRQLAEGDWSGAVRAIDEILVEFPRDILAIQIAHLVDFVRGDALNLRNRISRVLPHWSPSVPGYPFVVGMHAFGLEECNQYPEAESAGLRSLALAPEDCWAVHAVTHVYEMQGRIAEGIEFLQTREGDWATPDNGFAFHNWWHLALFHLDRGDHGAALDIYDKVLAQAHAMALSRVDATALLWRLMLEGVDIGGRFNAVADAWQGDLATEAGFYAFNDFHAAMSFAATARALPATQLRKTMEEAAWDKGSNGEMTREVGVDLAEGAFDFAAGRYAEAVRRLAGVRDIASKFGGSHAQRDLITLTMIEAARRGGDKASARHYLAERLVHKPASQWGSRIAQRIENAALQRHESAALPS